MLHGVEVADPYRWLEDGDSDETVDWVEAQNAWARAFLDALPGRARLHARLDECFGSPSSPPPDWRETVSSPSNEGASATRRS